MAEKRLAERAARLLGAAEALHEAIGLPQSPGWCADHAAPQLTSTPPKRNEPLDSAAEI